MCLVEQGQEVSFIYIQQHILERKTVVFSEGTALIWMRSNLPNNLISEGDVIMSLRPRSRNICPKKEAWLPSSGKWRPASLEILLLSSHTASSQPQETYRRGRRVHRVKIQLGAKVLFPSKTPMTKVMWNIIEHFYRVGHPFFSKESSVLCVLLRSL